MLHDRAILVRQHAFGNRETIGKRARLMQARREGLVEDDDLIASLGLIERLGGGGILVGVDRVFQRGTGPCPALLVEDQHDELTEIGGLLREELDFETFGQFEELLLLFGGATNALHIVIARITLRGRSLGGLGLLFRRLHLIPGQRTGSGRQFFNRDILCLDLSHAAGVDLDPDLTVGGDIRFGLEIIERRDPVDPTTDAVALGEDTILVPLAFFDGDEDRGGILGFSDDLVATALVVDLAVPAFTVVHLVAAHLGAVRDTHTAHLDAAVDEASAGQAQFHAQVEILVGLLGREEEVLRDLRRKRAAANLAGLDAPPSGIAFPAGKGLPIEQGNRSGVNGQGEEQGQEAAHGKRGMRRS